jgi:hypothetical protein
MSGFQGQKNPSYARGAKTEDGGSQRRKGEKIEIRSGEKYGRWTVLSYVKGKRKNGCRLWLCKCSCSLGTLREVTGKRLVGGLTKSCGCLTREASTTHGLSAHPLYPIWNAMKFRCYNGKCRSYKNYGAKGIKISQDWLEFENFLSWATTHGWEKELRLDRLDVVKGYHIKI